MAKWLPCLTAPSAEVVSPIETSIIGGLAERCVADRARKPAGPSAPLAVTTATPIARHPIAFQKVFASISVSMPGAPLLSDHLMRKECRCALPRCRARRRTHRLGGQAP